MPVQTSICLCRVLRCLFPPLSLLRVSYFAMPNRVDECRLCVFNRALYSARVLNGTEVSSIFLCCRKDCHTFASYAARCYVCLLSRDGHLFISSLFAMHCQFDLVATAPTMLTIIPVGKGCTIASEDSSYPH